MSEPETSPDKKNIFMTGYRVCALGVARTWSKFLLPVSNDLWRVGCAMCRPVVQGVAKNTSQTLRNLHNKKHWAHRSGATLWGNAIGLGIAMISGQLVTHFIEVRGAGNLWGLFSERTVVSEDGYRVISFIVEFVVTLVVFSAVEYFMDQRAQGKQDVEYEDEDQAS